MKNQKYISPEALTDFTNSVNTVFSEKLEEGFQLEIKAYEQFLDSYNRAFSDYCSAFKNYKADKLSLKFLSANVLLHKQIKEAMESNFDQNQALYFEQAFQTISAETLDIFSGLYFDQESEFYSFIRATEEQQFSSKPWMVRKIKKMSGKSPKNAADSAEGLIHSFLYFFYQQTVEATIEKYKETLFDLYRQLAVLAIDSWTSFENNTAFTNELHLVDYNFEALAADKLIWDLDNLPERKLNEIKGLFGEFSKDISSELRDKLMNFDFSLFLDQKKKFLVSDQIKANFQKELQQDVKSNILWRTTRFAFTEDISLDIEIYLFKYQIAQKKLLFIRAIDTVFNEPFYEDLAKFESQFDLILDDLNKNGSAKLKSNPDEALRKLRLQVKKELVVKSLPQLHQQLNSSGIIKEIDDFETMTQSYFALSPIRMLMKKPEYTRKIKPDELESIMPNDLISFEIKPNFIKVFPAFKRAVIEHIQNVLNEIETAPQIALFSIESAAQYLKESKSTDEVLTICADGLNRSKTKLSKTKLHETRIKNQEFFEKETEKFRTVIKKLVSSVSEIANNESAFQIKMRVVRAKALNRSKAFKDKAISAIVGFLPRFFASFKTVQQFIQDYIQRFLKYFELEKSSGFIAFFF